MRVLTPPVVATKARLALCLLFATQLAACGKKHEEDPGPTSSPEVIAELRGAKKGYVGAWVQSDAHGAPAYLDIGPRGGIHYQYKMSVPPYHHENIEGLIARFDGNDIVVSGPSPGTIVVTEPPQSDGDHWQMSAMKKTFGR